MGTSPPWPERVSDARSYLVRRGHVDPIVAVSTPTGRHHAGDVAARCEIGSVTKVFTALLLAVLARSGEVRLHDRLPGLLPPGTPLAPGVDGITLENLASHRSGLPRLPPGVIPLSVSRSSRVDPYADVDSDRLIGALARTRLRGAPGDAPVRYSNFGAGLLGLLLGRATGLGFEESLMTCVIAPLGLTATSFADQPLRQGRHRGRDVPPLAPGGDGRGGWPAGPGA